MQAWNKVKASEAMGLIAEISKKLLHSACGYLVELTSGLCLASFEHPVNAIAWGLHLVEALK
eukprot:424-Chlamydomonas_euryale.AAC.1